MEGIIPLIIIFVIGFAIFSIVMGNIRARQRRELLAAFASEHGLSFSAERREGMEEIFPGFTLFHQGSNRHAQNFVTGQWGANYLEMFDYHYQITSGSGKNRSTRHYYFTILFLRPPFPLKPLHIRAEGFWDKMKARFGWDDINFESAEFSARYHVSSPDRRWAYDVVTPQTMEFLMGRAEQPLLMDEVRLMVPLTGLCDRGRILYGLETATELLNRIPRFAREAGA